MKQLFLLSLITFSSICLISAQETNSAGLLFNPDPEKAEIIVSDIELFWRAYDKATPENNLIIYRDEYFKKGSVGLKQFVSSKIGNSCNLVTAIEAAPKYYAALRVQSAKVENYKPQMMASFKKLKGIYPDAVFPKVYFVIGRMNAGGNAAIGGLFIGVDMFGKTDETSVAELTGWEKLNASRIEEIPFTVAHELVHYQQKNALLTGLFGGEISLLGKALSEGGADFVGELISGENTNKYQHDYGNPREKELWLEFKKVMNGTDDSAWLYQGDRAKEIPADLGYYIGYKIVESYYKKAKDKKQAVKDILEIKDFDAFLKTSGYDEKFSVKN